MSDTLQKKHRIYGLTSVAAILIVGGILIAVNTIGTRLFVRADMTEGKEFTVSRPTRQILRRLDDLITVKVFFSKKVPPQVATLEQQVADVLKEYQVYSGGKVRVRFIDPAGSPEGGQEAQAMGIPELQMNVLEKDQYQVTKVYMGIGIQFGNKVQAIPVVSDAYTLEYDLTSAIVKLTNKEEQTVGFLTGHGEKDLQKDYQGVQKALDQQYKVVPVNLDGGASPVPESVNTLIVAGPKGIGDRERYAIDQYVMGGGKVVFLLDPVTMNEQMGLQAYPAQTGLEELVGFYGVGLKSSLALDARSAMASFSAGYISYTTPYPFWPKIAGDGFDKSSPITSRLESLTLPWTGPLEVKAARDGGSAAVAGGSEEPPSGSTQPDVKATLLAASSNRAWLQSGRYDLNPQTVLSRPARPTGERYPLAVALVGQFKSYFAGKPIPPLPAAPAASAEAPPPADTKPTLTESPLTQVVVVGNSQFVSDSFLRMFPENILFLQNTVDWMTLGDELIAIRSRGATDRPLKELSAGAKTGVKLALTFGIPALVAIFGLVRRSLRRRSRERLVQFYLPVTDRS